MERIEFDLNNALFKIRYNLCGIILDDDFEFLKAGCGTGKAKDQIDAGIAELSDEDGKFAGKITTGMLDIPYLGSKSTMRKLSKSKDWDSAYVRVVGRQGRVVQTDLSDPESTQRVKRISEIYTSTINDSTPSITAHGSNFHLTTTDSSEVPGSKGNATTSRIQVTFNNVKGTHRTSWNENIDKIREEAGVSDKSILDVGYLGHGDDIERDFNRSKKHKEKSMLFAQQKENTSNMSPETLNRYKKNQALSMLYGDTQVRSLHSMVNSTDKRHMIMDRILGVGSEIKNDQLPEGITQEMVSDVYSALYHGEGKLYDPETRNISGKNLSPKKRSSNRRDSAKILVEDREEQPEGQATVTQEANITKKRLLDDQFFEEGTAETPAPIIRYDLIDSIYNADTQNRIENIAKKPAGHAPNTAGTKWHHGHRQEVANPHLYELIEDYELVSRNGKVYHEKTKTFRINTDTMSIGIPNHDNIHNKQGEMQYGRLDGNLDEEGGINGDIDIAPRGTGEGQYQLLSHRIQKERQWVTARPLTAEFSVEVKDQNGKQIKEDGEYVGDSKVSVVLDPVSQGKWQAGFDPDDPEKEWDYEKFYNGLTDEEKNRLG